MSTSASPGLRYHGYAAVFCSLNDEQLIQTGQSVEHFQSIQNRFGRFILDYRRVMESEFKRAHQGVPHPFKSYLYKACRNIAFGYSDYLNFVLIDGLDIFYRLTNAFELPINQVTLAFCPVLESLGIPEFEKTLPMSGKRSWLLRWAAKWSDISVRAARELELKSCLVELHKLVETELPEGKTSYPFQSEAPLVMFARLKLGGLALLGPGGALRREIHRIIAAKVVQAQITLLRVVQDEESDEHELLDLLEVDEEAVRGIRVSMVDTQGPEEIGIYLSVKNYSVAVSILSFINNSTVSDLFINSANESKLRQQVESSQTHETIRHFADLAVKSPKTKDNRKASSSDEDMEGLLLDNYVFSSSYSIAGVADVSMEESLPNISGLVEVYARGNVLSGHMRATEKILSQSFEPVSNVRRISRHSIGRHLLGRFDLDFSLSWLADETLDLIETKEFLRRIDKIRETFLQDVYYETGLLEIASGIVVPLPRIADSRPSDDGPKGYRPVVPAFRRLTERLFSNDGLLNVEDLRDLLTPLRLPIRLERSILHLFKCFRDALLDPLLFDSLLDMLDVMVALQRLATRDIRQHVDTIDDLDIGSKEANFYREVVFREEMIDQLRDLVEATYNAISHRVWHHSRAELHDWGIGIRGGLTQIIHSTSVPIACGLDLLRSCWRSRFAVDSDKSQELDRALGMITRLTLYRRAESHRMQLTKSQEAVLGVFDVSIGHIFNPTEFIEHIEAVAKLILRVWDDEEPAVVEVRDSYNQSEHQQVPIGELDEETIELREELFARMLTQVLVFGTDWKLGLKHALISWNQQPIAGAAELSEILERFLDVSLHSFLALSMFREFKLGEDPSKWPLKHPWIEEDRRWRLEDEYKGGAYMPTELLTSLMEFVANAGPYCCHYDYIGNGFEQTKAVVDYCHNYWAKAIVALDDVWWRVVRIYRHHYKTLQDVDFNSLQQSFVTALKEGQASLHTLLDRLDLSEDVDEDSCEFELALVLKLLAANAQLEYEHIDPFKSRVHLRKNKQGDSVFDDPDDDGSSTKPWSEFLLDRRYPSPFCVNPDLRRDRMRRETTVHRILWSLSSRRRGRELAKLKDATPSNPSNIPAPHFNRVEFEQALREFELKNK